ncbi:MAG TPA: hypothetical protein VFG62_19805 [Rhodopila sp.]|nr:hypothetical protein [Rhodopila sp.]
MRGELPSLGRMAKEAPLDHGAACAAGQQPVGLDGGDPATSKAGAP